MSLFIMGLSFKDMLMVQAKLGVLSSSLASAVLGLIAFLWSVSLRKKDPPPFSETKI